MPDGLTRESQDIARRMEDMGLGGRAPGNECNARQYQLFGQYSTTQLVSGFQRLNQSTAATAGFIPRQLPPGERLWRVRSSGAELQRSSAIAVAPLPISQVLGPDTPAGASRGGSVTYKIEVVVTSITGLYRFFMDAGQAIEVVGSEVCAGVFGPLGTIVVNPSNDTLAISGQAGLLIDSVVGIAINAAEQSLSQTAVHLTEHFFIAANAQQTIPVPQHARRVKVYTGTGAAPASWTRHFGDPAILVNTVTTGTIDFVGLTSAIQSDPVGDESHIRTDLDPNNARFFTVVWTIQP